MIYTLTDNKRDIQQAPEYVFTPGDIVVVGNQPGPLIFESLAAFSNIGWVTNMDSDSVEGCPEDTALNGFYAQDFYVNDWNKILYNGYYWQSATFQKMGANYIALIGKAPLSYARLSSFAKGGPGSNVIPSWLDRRNAFQAEVIEEDRKLIIDVLNMGYNVLNSSESILIEGREVEVNDGYSPIGSRSVQSGT